MNNLVLKHRVIREIAEIWQSGTIAFELLFP